MFMKRYLPYLNEFKYGIKLEILDAYRLKSIRNT